MAIVSTEEKDWQGIISDTVLCFRNKNALHQLSSHGSWGETGSKDPKLPQYLSVSWHPSSPAHQDQAQRLVYYCCHSTTHEQIKDEMRISMQRGSFYYDYDVWQMWPIVTTVSSGWVTSTSDWLWIVTTYLSVWRLTPLTLTSTFSSGINFHRPGRRVSCVPLNLASLLS